MPFFFFFRQVGKPLLFVSSECWTAVALSPFLSLWSSCSSGIRALFFSFFLGLLCASGTIVSSFLLPFLDRALISNPFRRFGQFSGYGEKFVNRFFWREGYSLFLDRGAFPPFPCPCGYVTNFVKPPFELKRRRRPSPSPH